MTTPFIEAFLRESRIKAPKTGSEWADENRFVPAGTSPESGEWRTDRTPYLREPMDAATDGETEMVVMCCSSQLGKSEMLLNIMGYYADQEPAPQLMLQPTVEMAEAFSKERIEPMFLSSKGLKGKLEGGKDGRGSSRKSSTTIRMKHYPGGYLALVGANSPAGLASRPIRVLLCDEVDRYGVTKEGDPLKLAIQRTQNFHNRKIVMVSTPTIKGVSKIEEWFLRSDQRHFYIKCPHCGEYHELEWANVHFLRDENGEYDPKTAKMFCPNCGTQIRGPYKLDPRILETGVWRAENPASKIKGYYINALYSPWVNLHDLVEEFLTATKNRDNHGLMEFVNLKLGQAWEEVNPDADNWERFYQRREFYPANDVLPDGVLLLTAGVDVQRDRIECTVYGWGIGRECWGIEHRVLRGRPDDPQTWDKLDEVLLKQYSMSNGVQLPIACALVDSGDGAFTQNVYQFSKPRERRRVFSIKGRGGTGVPFISTPSNGNAMRATLITLGVDSGKTLVMGRLENEEVGPNFVHFAMQQERGFSEEFFKQLTAEVYEQRFEKGVVKAVWKKVRERNEALDCAVYATAAMELLSPNFESYADFYRNGGAIQQPSRPRKRGTLSKGITL
jgi:phage terminase large subunit GpA-like protein